MLPLLGGSLFAEAAIVPAELVAQAGDVPMGAVMPIASTRPPFVLSDGSVAFVGQLADGDAYVFIDDQVVWLGSDEMMSALTGTEQEMGAAVGGAFVYCPFVDGDEAVWTHNGLLALEGTTAPVLGGTTVSTFHSRPLMVDNGTPYWIAGINSTGGSITESRVLYRSPTALEADIEVVLSVGDMVGGLAIDAPSGIDTDYDVSPDETHRIHVLLMDTGSNINDGHIYVDGALIHQENTPNGTGDDWDNFDLVTINNDGLYVVSGDTNGATTSDEFVAVGGSIAVREGDVVDGVTLTSTAFVRMIAVNNIDRIAHAWSYGGAGGSETVFYGCDAGDLLGSSLAVLTTGVDELDFDGDGVGDALVTDLEANTTSRTRSLTDDEVLYLEVDIDEGMGPVEAMVRVPVTCCGNLVVDTGEECDDGDGDDTDECPGTCTDAVCGDGFVWAGMEECDDGNMANTDACVAGCINAMCGDGFLWAGVEACDDGNMDDSDGCPTSCMPAQCGDGFVWSGMEECDDGNDEQTDACLDNCVAATCGDGFVWEGTEECDDGNSVDTDDCPNSCMDPTCGDGIVWEGMEECDDGNDDPDDGCTNGCTIGRVVGSSSGDGSSDGSSTTGEPGTTGDPTTSGSGGLDDTTGPAPTTEPPVGSSGNGDSSGTDTGVFGGLDDDGGCTCRSGVSGSPRGALALMVLLLLRRRRRSPNARAASV